jgi:hypothetical protein
MFLDGIQILCLGNHLLLSVSFSGQFAKFSNSGQSVQSVQEYIDLNNQDNKAKRLENSIH